MGRQSMVRGHPARLQDTRCPSVRNVANFGPSPQRSRCNGVNTLWTDEFAWATAREVPGFCAFEACQSLIVALVGQTRWDDPMVEYEASIVLGGDDETAWKFVKDCCQRMTRLYKHNMTVIREVEKDSFGKHSYFRLVENSVYKEPQFERDYNEPAPYSNTDDASNVDETSEGGEGEAEGENHDSRGEANIGEYGNPEDKIDGIESGVQGNFDDDDGGDEVEQKVL